MYTIKVSYYDGNDILYENISKVEYVSPKGDAISLEGEKIFNHHYITNRTLHLYSDKSAYTVVSKNISCIEVMKE